MSPFVFFAGSEIRGYMQKLVNLIQEINEYLYCEGHDDGITQIKLGESSFEALREHCKDNRYYNFSYSPDSGIVNMRIITTNGEVTIKKDLKQEIMRLESEKDKIDKKIKELRDRNV